MRGAPTQLTEADLLHALRSVYDPELRANIVELGLIHSIAIAPDPDAPGGRIPGVPPRFRVTIGLLSREPNPSPPINPQPESQTGSQIVALIQNRLAGLPTISRADIHLLSEPRWSPDHIVPELRQRLSAAVASNQPIDALVQIQTAPTKSRSRS